MRMKQLHGRQARWAIELSAYDFEISHRSGKSNPADAPSRRADYDTGESAASQLFPTLQRKLAAVGRIQAGLVAAPVIGRLVTSATGMRYPEWSSSDVEMELELEGPCGPSLPRIAAVQVTAGDGPYVERPGSIMNVIEELQLQDAFVKDLKEKLQGPKRTRSGGVATGWRIGKDGLLYKNSASCIRTAHCSSLMMPHCKHSSWTYTTTIRWRVILVWRKLMSC